MSLELGDVISSGAETETLADDGSASVGDAVAINQSNGNVDQADSDTAAIATPSGVLASATAGVANTTVLSGRVIANVATNVEKGAFLNSSSTAGQFDNASSPSASVATALSAEGGTYAGESVPSGAAAIYFRGG